MEAAKKLFPFVGTHWNNLNDIFAPSPQHLKITTYSLWLPATINSISCAVSKALATATYPQAPTTKNKTQKTSKPYPALIPGR